MWSSDLGFKLLRCVTVILRLVSKKFEWEWLCVEAPEEVT